MTITIDPETANRILLFLLICAGMITLLLLCLLKVVHESAIREDAAEAARLRELND